MDHYDLAIVWEKESDLHAWMNLQEEIHLLRELDRVYVDYQISQYNLYTEFAYLDDEGKLVTKGCRVEDLAIDIAEGHDLLKRRIERKERMKDDFENELEKLPAEEQAYLRKKYSDPANLNQYGTKWRKSEERLHKEGERIRHKRKPPTVYFDSKGIPAPRLRR